MKRTTTDARTGNARCVLAVVLAVAVVMSAGTAAPVVGGDEDAPPAPPASFYGEVSVDGDPAPTGTEIVAVVDGEERGTITTDEPGAYGGPNVGDDKLVVEGSSDDAGAPITFLVNDQEVDVNATWEAGSLTELDLELEGSGDDGVGGGIDDDGGDDGDGDHADSGDDEDEAADDQDGDGDESDDRSNGDSDGSNGGSDDDGGDSDGGDSDALSVPGFTAVGAVIASAALLVLRRR